MLITLIFLSLSFSSEVLWTEYIDRYNQIVHDQNLAAEGVWGMGVLYYSSPGDIQIKILERVESDLLTEVLENNDQFNTFIQEVNEYLRDESLLLLSLLLEEDEKTRDRLFDDFYTDSTPKSLYLINRFARRGEEIITQAIDVTDFQFHHFLIAFYISTNKVASEEYFKNFSDYWMKTAPVKHFDSVTEDFLSATIAMSSHQTNNFGNLVSLYDDIQELHYIPPSSLKRSIYWATDFAMYRAGKIDMSLEIQRAFTIPISEYMGDDSNLAFIQASMGGYLYLLGKYEEARVVCLSALEHSEQLSDAVLTRLYNNLSLIYFKTGESSRYIEMQLQALEQAKTLKNYSHQISIYRNLHIFHRKNRNWDLATSYIDQAAELAQETNNQSDLVSIYISQAVYEDQYLNNRETAFQKLKTAESFLTEQSEPRFHIRVLSERSKLLNKDQRWSESKKLWEQIIAISAAESNPTYYLEALTELAKIEFQQGNFSVAAGLFNEFKAHDISVLDFQFLVSAQTLQAKLAVENGNYKSADELFSSASELVLERARNTSELETGYWSVEPEYLYLFESYADFLITRGKNSEAVILLDRVKTINDASLVENPLIKSSVLTEEELSAERQISREMDEIRKQIFNASADEKLSYQNQLESLSAQRRELNRNLNVTHDRELPNLWSLQRSLIPGQKILHITELQQNFYISVISKYTIDVKKLHLSAETSGIFENGVASVVGGRANLELLYKAGQFIDLQSISRETGSLIVIPDGYFHQLPMDIIPLQPPDSPYSYGSARYAIEQMDVRHLNSLNDLSRRSNTPTAYEADFTGFGIEDFKNDGRTRNLVSLPKAPEEVQNISDILYRMNTKNTVLNEEATPGEFRSSAGKSRILHLATHSEVSDSDPLFSRLHLSTDPAAVSGSKSSDHLFAYELFDLNMQNQLVMLNSCESGGDRFLQGSGIMGISRALRYAGANSLVLNAWSVNDQFAADFAVKFYSYLNAGETKSRALQLTKIYFIKEKNANPHYWGPYMLNGDNRPLLSREESNAGMYLLAGVFLTGIIVLRKGRNKAA